jgi:hypothetical protein
MIFKGWTDYPFVALGDTEGMEAPIRECEVLSYDGDKRVTIMVEGLRETIKAAYVYMVHGRCGCVPAISRRILMSLDKTEDSA